MTKKTPKVGYLDIETLPMICTTFTLRPEYLSPKSIMQEGSIICIGVKIKGKSDVNVFSILDDKKTFKKDPFNDLVVLKKFRDFMVKEDFDLIVGHNGDSFDLKIINARLIKHGLQPIPPVASDDTLKMARSRFKFHSNKLEHLVKFLGIDAKGETNYSMWLDIIKGSEKAVKEMIAYNKQDVKILEKVHEALLPFCKSKLNMKLYVEGADVCPSCGSAHLQKRGVMRTISAIFTRLQCQKCGSWHKGPKVGK